MMRYSIKPGVLFPVGNAQVVFRIEDMDPSRHQYAPIR